MSNPANTQDCFIRRWSCSTSVGPLEIICPVPLRNPDDLADVVDFVKLFLRQLERTALTNYEKAQQNILNTDVPTQ